MRQIIDMGKAHGKQTFHVSGNPTWGDLIREGVVVAIPDAQQGIVYKFPSQCTTLELAAALTVEEADAIAAKWNAQFDAQEDES